MKLTLEQVQAITVGAADVEQTNNGRFLFWRFTQEQRDLYANRGNDAYLRSLSAAGVRLAFQTDSTHLSMMVSATSASSALFFGFDLWVNGEYVDSLCNFDGVEMTIPYTLIPLSFKRLEKTFSLGEGVKTVEVYFPWSAQPSVEYIELDDGASVTPVRRKHTLLAFGDSITQGYHSLCPSNMYVCRLARMLDADEWNKGVGGEMFFPELSATKEKFTPDIITVAYGCNDCHHRTREQFEEHCRAFFDNLRATYPTTRIVAISPIWLPRGGELPFGRFEDAHVAIERCIDGYDIELVNGIDLVPHDENLFGDGTVHPSDEGFGYYADNLIQYL